MLSRRSTTFLVLFTLVVGAMFLLVVTPTPSSSAGMVTIAFMRAGPDPYYQFGENAAKVAAGMLNIQLIDYMSNVNPATELGNVRDAITRGVNGILMYAVSLSSERATIDAAATKKVPVFFQYGYDKSLLPKVGGFMQIDVGTFGTPLGEWMATHLSSGTVGIIEGQLGRGDAEAYTEGFLTGLKKNPQLTVVAKSPGDWNRQKAYDIATSMITAHPDLKGLFVQNEDMAFGAVLALQKAGKLAQVTVVSMNGAPYGLDLIKKGQLALTNANPPSIASVYALRLLQGIIAGQVKPGNFYWAPTQVISKANVDKAIRWDAPEAQIREWVNSPLPKPVVPAP